MLWSKLFIPTLREAPSGIPSIGGRLLTRAGYVRGEACLFLGAKSRNKIAAIIRAEMDSLGAQEVLAPTGKPMTALARELRSYKQLPQIWYQFNPEFEACSFGMAGVDLRESLSAFLRRCGIECLIVESLCVA